MQMQEAQSPAIVIYMQPQPTAPGMMGMYPVMLMPSGDYMNVIQPYSNPAGYHPPGAEAFGY